MSSPENNTEESQKRSEIMFMLMTNGDEVLGQVYETDDDTVVCIKNPLIITRVESDNGFNINLNKWVPYTDDVFFAVRRDMIGTQAVITDNLKKFYSQSLDKIEQKDSKDNVVETVDMSEEIREQYLNKNIIIH